MKNRLFLIFTFLFFSLRLFAQLEGIIINKVTNTSISYANIWIANKDIGITSDTDGSFLLKDTLENETLIVTAIGYEKAYIQIDSSYVIVALEPKIYQIPEVRISPGSNDELVIGRFKRIQILDFICPSTPEIYARFFPNKEEYGTNATIKSIKFMSLSFKKAEINMRILSVTSKGEPGVDIFANNYIIPIKRGRNINRIELSSETNIPFPETGIFVAFEFLIIRENEFIPHRYKNQSGEIIKNNGEVLGYFPAIGQVKSENPVGWVFREGKWLNKQNSILYKSEKRNIAVELTLKH